MVTQASKCASLWTTLRPQWYVVCSRVPHRQLQWRNCSLFFDVKVMTLWRVKDNSQWPWRQTKTEISYLCYNFKQRIESMEGEWNISTGRWWNEIDMGWTNLTETVTMPLRLQIPYIHVRDRIQAFGIRSQRLTALTMQFRSHFTFTHRRREYITLYITAHH